MLPDPECVRIKPKNTIDTNNIGVKDKMYTITNKDTLVDAAMNLYMDQGLYY